MPILSRDPGHSEYKRDPWTLGWGWQCSSLFLKIPHFPQPYKDMLEPVCVWLISCQDLVWAKCIFFRCTWT